MAVDHKLILKQSHTIINFFINQFIYDKGDRGLLQKRDRYTFLNFHSQANFRSSGLFEDLSSHKFT